MRNTSNRGQIRGLEHKLKIEQEIRHREQQSYMAERQKLLYIRVN